jgi:hypothetical protein
MGSSKLLIEEDNGFTTHIKEFWGLNLLISFHKTKHNPEATLSLSLHGVSKQLNHASAQRYLLSSGSQ